MDMHSPRSLGLASGLRSGLRSPTVRTDLSVDSCPLHMECCQLYCSTCKELICGKCTGHEGHKVKWVTQYINKLDGIMKDFTKLNSVLPQIVEHIEETRNKLRVALEKRKDLKIRRDILVNIKLDKETAMTDLNLLISARDYLKDLEDVARTPSLRDAIIQAKQCFNIEQKIKNNIEDIDIIIDENNKDLEDSAVEIRKFFIQHIQLKSVKQAIEDHSISVESRISFFVLQQNNMIPIDAYISTGSKYYEAFPGVKDIFNISNVMSQELIDVNRGVKISQPIICNKKLIAEGNFILTSLSHSGVIAINSFNRELSSTYPNSPGINSCILQLTNLIENIQVEVDIENPTQIGFYDDMMIFITSRFPLREIGVTSFFRTPQLRNLAILTRESAMCDTDVSLLNTSRVLYYRGVRGELHAFYVDPKSDSIIDTGCSPYVIPSLTGIDVGVRTIFQDGKDSFIYALEKDKTMTLLTKQRNPKILRTIFPSRSEPKDLHRALFQQNEVIVYYGQSVELNSPIGFRPFRSVVRLFNDVFLVNDLTSKKWVLCRIIVP